MKKLLFTLPIILLLAAGCNSSSTSEPAPTPTPTPQQTENNFVPQFPNTDKNGLVISPQSSTEEVNIDQYFLEKPGFVVIHEIKNDSAGAVLGYSSLVSGLGNNLKIKATLKSGSVYFALLYQDDGDKKFDITKDKQLPLYSSQSATYSNSFVAQFITK